MSARGAVGGEIHEDQDSPHESEPPARESVRGCPALRSLGRLGHVVQSRLSPRAADSERGAHSKRRYSGPLVGARCRERDAVSVSRHEDGGADSLGVFVRPQYHRSSFPGRQRARDAVPIDHAKRRRHHARSRRCFIHEFRRRRFVDDHHHTRRRVAARASCERCDTSVPLAQETDTRHLSPSRREGTSTGPVATHDLLGRERALEFVGRRRARR